MIAHLCRFYISLEAECFVERAFKPAMPAFMRAFFAAQAFLPVFRQAISLPGTRLQRVPPAGRPACGRDRRPTALRENRDNFGRSGLGSRPLCLIPAYGWYMTKRIG